MVCIRSRTHLRNKCWVVSPSRTPVPEHIGVLGMASCMSWLFIKICGEKQYHRAIQEKTFILRLSFQTKILLAMNEEQTIDAFVKSNNALERLFETSVCVAAMFRGGWPATAASSIVSASSR